MGVPAVYANHSKTMVGASSPYQYCDMRDQQPPDLPRSSGLCPLRELPQPFPPVPPAIFYFDEEEKLGRIVFRLLTRS
jgi:hypothetical protein